MSKRVLVATDGSPQSEAALDLVADEWPAATVVLLHVVDPVQAGYRPTAIGPTSEEWYEREKAAAADLFEEAAGRLGDDATVETVLEVGRPSKVIVRVADREDVDHVVLGSHGREGVSRILLGSVAETVVRRSPVPVTVVR
jgi:nucleotide-binding universal stress UspA family protein